MSDTALTLAEPGVLTTSTAFSDCNFTSTSLEIPPGKPFEEWGQIIATLSGLQESCLWYLADAIRYGEAEYGEKYAQAIQITGYSEQTLMNAVWVAGRWPREERVEGVAWSIHAATASLPMEERRPILDAARDFRLTRREVEERVHLLKAKAKSRDIDESILRTSYRWESLRRQVIRFAEDNPQFAAYAMDFADDVDFELNLAKENPDELVLARFDRGCDTYIALQKGTGMSIQTVRRAVARLVSRGVLEVEDRGYKTGYVGTDADLIRRGPRYAEGGFR